MKKLKNEYLNVLIFNAEKVWNLLRKMDSIDFAVRGALTNVANGISFPGIPDGLKPILSILFASLMIGFFQSGTIYLKSWYYKIVDALKRYQRTRSSYNAIELHLREFLTKERFTQDRYTDGYPEVLAYMMYRFPNIKTRSFIPNASHYTTNCCAPEYIPRMCFDAKDDIWVEMESEMMMDEGVNLLKSKMTISSRTKTLGEIQKWIRNVVDLVTMNSHTGELSMYVNKLNDSSDVTFDKYRLNLSNTVKRIFLSQAQETLMKNMLKRFENRDWYIEKGVPHKLFTILYGPPGTGKTSFIKYLARKYNRHIVSINLAHATDANLRQILMNSRFEKNYGQVIFVLEEIDTQNSCVLKRSSSSSNSTLPDTDDNESTEKEEKNMKLVDLLKKTMPHGTSKDSLSLGTLLQTLDGVLETPGMMLVATTNHIEKLDPALVRRFHLRMELGYLTRYAFEQMLDHFYGHSLTDKEWYTYGRTVETMTPNTMTEYCIQSMTAQELFANLVT